MMYAAIDLGTVTSRLMIAEEHEGRLNTFCRRMVITNIGEGLTQSGNISDAAYTRLLSALLEFKEEIVDAQTQLLCEGRACISIPLKIIATSAMRDAANAAQILEMLSDVGFDIDVITGKREAELSFKGTLSGFSHLDEPVLSIDVGGGSTELILGDKAAHIDAFCSFDIGSRRVTEMFLQQDPPTKEALCEARAWIDAQIVPFIEELPQQPAEVLAVAGTATSAVTVRDEIVEYDRSLVHGKRVSLNELQQILKRLSELTLEERKVVGGLEPGRAPVIVGGLLVLLAVLESLGKTDFLVSDTDILEGIILTEATIC